MGLNYSNEIIRKKSRVRDRSQRDPVQQKTLSVGHEEANCHDVLKNSEPFINVDNPYTIYQKKKKQLSNLTILYSGRINQQFYAAQGDPIFSVYLGMCPYQHSAHMATSLMVLTSVQLHSKENSTVRLLQFASIHKCQHSLYKVFSSMQKPLTLSLLKYQSHNGLLNSQM